jgi:hypothetical protein
LADLHVARKERTDKLKSGWRSFQIVLVVGHSNVQTEYEFEFEDEYDFGTIVRLEGARFRLKG